jgi:hypothetical protein
MVFENRVLRRTFGPIMDEVVGGSTKLHNEELHNLYSSQNVIKMMKPRRTKWAEHVACMRGKRNIMILEGKPEGKRPPGRPRRRWGDNIIMDLIEIRWCGMNWIDLAQDRDQWKALINSVMNFRVLLNVGKFLSR